MAFEYGSQQVDIPNPFRFEGMVSTARAGVLVLLGLVTLFRVRTLVSEGGRFTGVLVMLGGLALLAFGLLAAYRGLHKAFRFYVGRGMPSDLVDMASSQSSIMPGEPTGGSTGPRHSQSQHGVFALYERTTLAEMLLGRKNITFHEPQGWLQRLLHSLAPKMIFLPYALRNDAGSRFSAATHGVVLLALLALAGFSAATGLLPIAGTPVMGWLTFFVAALLLIACLREVRGRFGATRAAVIQFSPVTLGLSAAGAIFAPLVLVWLNGVTPLPEPPFSPYPWFAATLLVTGISAGFSLYLGLRRAPRDAPPTTVTEYREHWQESVHPMDIFRAIEMTLAKHRFQEIPNRVYENNVPELAAQGSGDKGDFKGRTIQEIQPRPIADRCADQLLRAGIVVGQTLQLLGGVVVFVVLIQASAISMAGLSQSLLAAVLLWCAGRLINETSTLYTSEIDFESDLIVFEATGTFSESSLATGMSIFDSTRSENTIVRSSLTPWLLVSRLRTSILTVSGPSNLEQPRSILSLSRNDTLSHDIVTDLRTFLRDRQIIATVASAPDLQAAANIFHVNERTRAAAAQDQMTLATQHSLGDKQIPTGGPPPSEKDRRD